MNNNTTNEIRLILNTVEALSSMREALYDDFLNGAREWEDTNPMLGVCDQYVKDAQCAVRNLHSLLEQN